jgi:hypothetical protein
MPLNLPKQKLILILALSSFFSSTCYSQFPSLQIPGMSSNSGTEYFVGRIEGKSLITVHLIGGVAAQGIYHLPIQSDLTQLLTYAGGVGSNADLSEVVIRSERQKQISNTTYDFEKLLAKNGQVPILQDNDTIFIHNSSDKLERTALIIGIVGGIASIITTIIVLKKSN